MLIHTYQLFIVRRHNNILSPLFEDYHGNIFLLTTSEVIFSNINCGHLISSVTQGLHVLKYKALDDAINYI